MKFELRSGGQVIATVDTMQEAMHLALSYTKGDVQIIWLIE